METPVLDQPLSSQELRQQQDRHGYVSAVVRISLSQVIHGDFEAFLDALSEALIDTGMLMDIHYELVGCELPDALLLKVSGDVTLYWDDSEVE